MAERVFRIKELDGGRYMLAEFSDGKGCTTIVTTSQNLPKQVEVRMEKGDMCNFPDDMDGESIWKFASAMGKIRQEKRVSGIRFRCNYSA